MKRRFILIAALGLCMAAPAVLRAQQCATASATPKSLLERDALAGDWGGLRSCCSNGGFDARVNYTGEVIANTRGGVRRGALYQGLLRTDLDFDLGKIAGWQGAHFHASSLWTEGSEPNSSNDIAGMTGSLFSDPSSISAYDTLRLYELWLEQSLFDGNFSVKFGQIALDEEFLCNGYSCAFMAGTHGWSAFLASAIPDGGEAYPLAGTGVRLKLKPAERFEIIAALTDGDVHGQSTDNRHGGRFGFRSQDGLLSIMEVIYRLNQEPDDTGLPGAYKLGGWYHSGHFADLRRDNLGTSLEDDGTLSGLPSTGTPATHDGDGTVYLDASQMLWRKRAGSDEGLGCYARVAPWLPGDRNPLDFYAAGGLNVKGPLPGRGADVFALGVYYAHVSESLRGAQRDANRIAADGGTPNNLSPGPMPDYEAAIEATYQLSLAPWWTLQPDVQCIIHPGGSPALKNAVVAGLRTCISF